MSGERGTVVLVMGREFPVSQLMEDAAAAESLSKCPFAFLGSVDATHWRAEVSAWEDQFEMAMEAYRGTPSGSVMVAVTCDGDAGSLVASPRRG